MLTADRLERIRKRHLTGEYASFKAVQDDVGELLAEADRLRVALGAAEATLDDEEAAHQETVRRWQAAKAEAERLAGENARLREIVQEVVDGTDFCDPRMRYGECQIGRGQLEEMKAALAPPE